jgi:RNA polymerase sigma-70 factor (ECF subfamily)
MDDETLVRRCLAGDQEAFGEIVSRYERPLYNVALRTLRNPEDARDATQSAFVKAWLHLGQFDRSRRLFSWLYRIALNESFNRLRMLRRQAPLDDRLIDRGPAPDESAVQHEGRRHLEQAMAQLSDSQREVIVLRHWLQLSYDEIADTLGIPPKTVKSRLFSARTRLGEVLRSMGIEAP